MQEVTTKRTVMAMRVLASALVGVLAGAFPIDPIILALYQRRVIHNDYWFSIGLFEAVKISLERAPGMAVLALLIASPLIAIAVLAGMIFRRQIDRHPMTWALIAPFMIWLFVCAVFAAPDNDQSWQPHRPYATRLFGAMQAIDNSLFFFALAAAAVCFAILTHRAARSRLGSR